ncbi:hypothetical protein IB229_11190 [Pseudomonas sp. PDM14]|uniref:hypothetical protein n=1 Tax=Pseudomonas sp. PDM14 TaxID=2769288 RepID=UPI001786845B|nr:hypothetical protein [Pseudomonas sp. PDM14]MBD9483540.1 hypothetical protein [Pseudomonas sp. PDM14]
MNSISGIGGHNPLSVIGRRAKEGFREEELAAPQPVIPPSFKATGTYDHQTEAAYEEAFAKLRVNLQNRAEIDGVESSVSRGTLTQSLTKEDPAVQAFREYMDMTPAEKMRDAILKEMGLSEEEVDAMSPEQQEAIEKEIAERMQDRAELQAAKEIEENANGFALANGSPEEEAALLS